MHVRIALHAYGDADLIIVPVFYIYAAYLIYSTIYIHGRRVYVVNRLCAQQKTNVVHRWQYAYQHPVT